MAAAASLIAHDPITTKVTWEREIAPIVRARCLTCHTPGGRAPMSLATYAEARPWARAIREEVLARRMPKWPVVRGYGDFVNDPSLTSFEIALITAWADGGAPESAPRPFGRPMVPAAPLQRAPNQPEGRTITIPCASTRLPAGRLLAVRPSLPDGRDIRLTVRDAAGAEEPILWIREFDATFDQPYVLRNPIAGMPGSRLIVATGAPKGACTLTLAVQ